ncbi:hypothetical protein FDP41_001376 [Naegleria fowleri]|uniref:TPR-like protein n=1 Tax=Naegleria fowleri TaxID=5763 RepID=A0A6A5C1E4_NAEFO|nr:uncharacterized protein FDP41_001376 [Naegleria fowleri]KAF0979708.1 hypothetical protein FDP41_001376 [Naegleria fowleri]
MSQQEVDLTFESFTEGTTHLQNSHYQQAIDCYTKTLHLLSDPKEDDSSYELNIRTKTHFYKGLAHFHLSQFTQAIQEFSTVDTILQNYESSKQHQQHDEEDPATVLASLFPTRIKSLEYWARSLHKPNPSSQVGTEVVNKDQQALHLYSRAIDMLKKTFDSTTTSSSMIPRIHTLYMSRGLLHSDLKHFQEAIQDFSRCLQELSSPVMETIPNQAFQKFTAHHNRAIAYESLKNSEQEALEDYSKAIECLESGEVPNREALLSEKESEALNTYLYRALLLYNMTSGGKKMGGNSSSSAISTILNDLHVVLKYNPHHLVANQIAAQLSYEAKDYEKARDSYSRLISICKKQSSSSAARDELYSYHFNHGMCCKFLGDELGALEDFEKTIELNDEYFKGFVELARLRKVSKRDDDTKEMIQLYDRAISLLEKNKVKEEDLPNNKSKAALYFERGVLQSKIEEYESSVQDFTKCLQIENDHVDALFNRANIYRTHLKEFSKALKDAETVSKLDPNDLEAMMEVGLCLFELDKIDQAKKQFEKILQKDPHHEGAKNYLDYLNDADENDEE